MKRGQLKNSNTKANLTKQYNLNTKTISEVSEELKQRVTATAKKIERYEARVTQFRQNSLFRTNQRRFYDGLDRTSAQDSSSQTKMKLLPSGVAYGTIQRRTTRTLNGSRQRKRN